MKPLARAILEYVEAGELGRMAVTLEQEEKHGGGAKTSDV